MEYKINQNHIIKIDGDLYTLTLTEKVIYEVLIKDLENILLQKQPDYNQREKYKEYQAKLTQVKIHAMKLATFIQNKITEEGKKNRN